MTGDDLKKLNKDKMVKKLAKSYDAFLASDTRPERFKKKQVFGC